MSGGTFVIRWTRYGHDRLYATAGEVKLGYWDNKAHTLHPESPESDRALRQALDAYWSGGGQPGNPTGVPLDEPPALDATAPVAAAEPVDEQPEDAPVSVADVAIPAPERPWTDLADNRPGDAAREQAVAAREAAPVKTIFARVRGVHTEERGWRIGADGEEAVGARLAKLPKSWRVIHAVPVGNRGSDIDHVVIGPGGVYTINTKHHPRSSVWVGGNTFIVNGQKQPYIRNSRYEAARASKMLTALAGFPVFVSALIAVVGAHEGLSIKAQPPGGDVYVVARKKVADWLLQRGPVLTDRHVDTLFEIARRSTTWTG
jgi:hypothetical protein